MQECTQCGSVRVATISAHASDMFNVSLNGTEYAGYLPYDLGVGGGDDLEINLCLDCGRVQGKWPLPQCELEVSEPQEPRDYDDPDDYRTWLNRHVR